MKKHQLKQIIKETIKEIQVNQPKKLFIINSPEYKKFYQMVEINDYWGIDWKDEFHEIDFTEGLGDFDFFYFIFTIVTKNNWKSDKCILKEEDLKEGFEGWGIEDDEEKQNEIMNKIKEHKI